MNPKPENLQFLGVFGILQETLRLIYQWRKIFTQLTFAFVLPSYLFAFTNMVISLFFLPKTTLSIPITPQAIYCLIFQLVSSILSVVFSLYSVATITYTVACIYTAHDEVSFKHVISVMPKVWKRLLVTFLTIFVGLFAFNFVAFFVIFLIFMIVYSINGPNFGFSFDNNYSLTIVFILVILIYVGNFYLMIIWQLSYEVSVLEESSGFEAMSKSKALVKGKIRMITKVLVMLVLPLGVIQLVIYHQIPETPLVGKCILMIVLVLLFSFFSLATFVAKTVIYFVCKSYHHEIVDKLSLSDHLQTYVFPIYVPLKADDRVQIEKLQVV